jgi:hypothetical protein
MPTGGSDWQYLPCCGGPLDWDKVEPCSLTHITLMFLCTSFWPVGIVMYFKWSQAHPRIAHDCCVAGVTPMAVCLVMGLLLAVA